MSRDVATLDDLAQLEAYAAEYAELADAQRAETVPSGAEAINRALVATLGAYADSLNQILTADEPGKDPAIELVEAVNTFNAAGERMGQIQAQLAKFSAECGLG
jgi:hypothetical protein